MYLPYFGSYKVFFSLSFFNEFDNNFHFAYANTGLEHEKTLEFVDRVDKILKHCMDINQDNFSKYAERLGYKTYFTDNGDKLTIHNISNNKNIGEIKSKSTNKT